MVSIDRSHEVFRHIERDYWEYYRELEAEFIQMRKYVDFTADNFNTYSVELLKLFQAVCSEIDAIGKAMATLINPEFKPNDKSNNIYKWWYIIQDEYYVTDSYAGVFKEQREPTIRLSECTHVFCDSFEICAWDNFRIEIREDRHGRKRHELVKGCKVPKWWSDYNKIKHNRMAIVYGNNSCCNYYRANLENVCNSFAALYTLEKSLMESVGTKNDLEAFYNMSDLFTKPAFTTTEEIDKLFERVGL